MNFLIISLLIAVVSSATTNVPVGEKVDVDVNSAPVKDAATFAYEMISASLNPVHALKQGTLEKAQSQVVSGVKYFLTLDVVETDCAKTVTDTTNCNVINTKICQAIVLSRPWDTLHKKQLESYQCTDKEY